MACQVPLGINIPLFLISKSYTYITLFLPASKPDRAASPSWRTLMASKPTISRIPCGIFIPALRIPDIPTAWSATQPWASLIFRRMFSAILLLASSRLPIPKACTLRAIYKTLSGINASIASSTWTTPTFLSVPLTPWASCPPTILTKSRFHIHKFADIF